MQTSHPHSQSITPTILDDLIITAREYAEAYANSMAESILPIIMPWDEWTKHWDFAWNSVYNYASDGLTLQQFYGGSK